MATFLKDTIRIGVSKSIIIVLGLSTSIITARYIGPEGNGIIAALLVYPSLFMSFGSLGISQSTTYFLGKGIYSESQIKTAVAQIWIITTIIALVVCFILIRYFSNSGSNILLVLLALSPIPFTLFNQYNSGIFLGKNDIGTFNKINWIPSLVILFFTALFVVALVLDIAGAMMAMALGPLFISFILLYRNRFVEAFNLKFNWKIIKAMLSLGVVYAVALVVINLNYKIDIILLDKLSTSYELGIYSKGAGITQYLWQIPLLFGPIIFARSANAEEKYVFSLKVAQLLRISIILIGGASIILALLSKFIVVLMYGEKFTGSVSVLNYLLPGVLLLTFYKVMNMDLAGRGKPWVSVKAMLPALVLNVFLNIILIPRYGADGSALASTVSYTLAGLLFLYLYSKETRIPIRIILRYKSSDFEPILTLGDKIFKKR